MKKVKYIALIIMFGFLLTSCGNNNTKDNNLGKTEKVETKKVNDLTKEEEEEVNKQREEISLNEISKIFVDSDYEPKNELEEKGQEFISGLNEFKGEKVSDNINGGIPRTFAEIKLSKFPKNLIREFDIELTIKDYKTKENIVDGTIYVNGINLGEFKNGKFVGKFKWLKGIEKFNIMARSPDYGDGFIVLNSINSEGSLLMSDILLKKAKIKNIVIGDAQEIKYNDTIIGLNKCSLVNSNGNCIKGDVKMKINHIAGNEANNYEVSLNREAITKDGKIVKLTSGGMSFIDFIGEEGEILKLKNGEKIKISYKITKEDIETMANKKMGNGTNEGYWYYDKNKGIWFEGTADYILDKEKMIWTVETNNLY